MESVNEGLKEKNFFVETKFIFQESHVFRIEKFYLKNPIIENQIYVKKRHRSRTAPVNFE